MRAMKIILSGAAAVLVCFFAFQASMGTIENMNAQYEAINPAISEEPDNGSDRPTYIDKMISHSVEGTEDIELPIDTEQKYTIYEDKLYVTANQGNTWLPVPDDADLGYARISDYTDQITANSIFINDEKIAIAYGGRGSENISILYTRTGGEAWSVGTISQTANHDLENGYEELYIDFLEDSKTGYFAAVTADREILAFRSVNSGVTWDPVRQNEPLYSEILTHFTIQGTFADEE